MRPVPIFIVSALPRTGTNYLWELLRRHPDCAPARSPLWEDYLVLHAEHLTRFADAAQSSWDVVWGPTEHLKPELLRHIGHGIISFLGSDPERRLVTKSPTVGGIEVFFDVWPDADLLILVRDGRDVVASGIETFGWTLEGGARGWAQGVDRVISFVGANRDRRVRLVRFEELVENVEASLTELLRWLNLDPGAYPSAELADIPVRGSSTYRGGHEGVHWHPLARPHDFRPIHRWAAWSDAEVQRFHDIAGPQLALLGYDGETPVAAEG